MTVTFTPTDTADFSTATKSVTINVDKANLTLTAATFTKTYDTTTSASALPTFIGLQGSDTVTGLTEAYTDANAGAHKRLTVTGYTVNDGAAGANYNVIKVDSSTGVVNQANLTITAATNTKVYDATTTAAAKPTFTGQLGTDTVTNLMEAYTDANAGAGKTLTVSYYVVNDGNSGNNYKVTTVADKTGAITPASLTLTAITNTKYYDATTSAAATPAIAGLQGADTVTGLTEKYSDINAGTAKALSVATFTINDGNSGNNYTVTKVADSTGAVSPAPLTITAAANTKTYDKTTTATATPTVAGLHGSDTVTGLGETYADSDAGSHKLLTVNPGFVVNDGNGGQNYTVETAESSAGVINQAQLTITATTNTKGYDGTATASATPTFSGLLTGDTVTDLMEAYDNRNAGTGKTLAVTDYVVTDGNSGNNYVVTTVNDTTGSISVRRSRLRRSPTPRFTTATPPPRPFRSSRPAASTSATRPISPRPMTRTTSAPARR